MKYTDFNINLAHRLVADYGLPMYVVPDAEIFHHDLEFYEDRFEAKTKWHNLIDVVNELFEGNPEYFSQWYYKTCDNILDYIESLESFQKFNNDANLFREWRSNTYPVAKHKNPFNPETSGRRFVSIDLKKANFQALKYLNVLDDKDYESFIGRFTEGQDRRLHEYMVNSKKTRQALLGKKNAGRQMTAEKVIMNKTYNERIHPICPDNQLIYFNTDEIILEVNKNDDMEQMIEKIKESVKDMPVVFRVEGFLLEGYEFYVIRSDGHKKKLGEFYHRSCDGKDYFKCLPMNYGKIIRRLMNGEPVLDKDRIIVANDCKVMILDDFAVEKM